MFNRVSAQDVSASYGSIGIVRVTFTAERQTERAAAATGTAPGGDSVSLSPQALASSRGFDSTAIGPGSSFAAPGAGDATIDPTAAPPPSPPTGSRADRLAAALIRALDADQDGALSREEFVDGAPALLGRGGARRRGEDDAAGADDVSRSNRGNHYGRGHRLEHRLERAFSRIDADDNGSLDAGELAAVLARVSDKAGTSAAPAGTALPTIDPTIDPTTPTTPDQPTAVAAQDTAAAPSTTSGALFSFSMTTVTFVSVAVQRYQAVTGLKA